MLNNLYNFKIITEEQGITPASKKLFISQPGLSLYLKKIEKEAGGKLFIRKKGKLKLTKLGKLIYKISKEENLLNKKLNRNISELNKEKIIFSIGLIDNAVELLTGNKFKNFLKINSNLRLNIIVDNSTNLIKLLNRHEIDIAIVTEGIRINKSYNKKFIYSENLIGIINKQFNKIPTKIIDLKNIPLITYNKESTSFKIISNKLRELNIFTENISHSTNPQVMIELVKLGLGYSIIPENLINNNLKSIFSIPVIKNKFKRNIIAVYREKGDKYVEGFLEMIKK